MELGLIFWKQVPNYPSYEVSSDGQVVSKSKRLITLKPKERWDGYYEVALWKEGARKFFKVHRLVMLSFEPREASWEFQVNHRDGNKKNNAKSNLEWVTPRENIKHMLEMYREQRKNYQNKRRLQRENISKN